jgi:DNA processing protein
MKLMIDKNNEHFNLLGLSFLDGIGIIKANQLLDYFGSATAIFDSKAIDLATSQILNKKQIQQVLSKETLKFAEIEFEFCDKNKIEILSPLSDEYPKRLNVLEDKPIILFKKGNIHPKVTKSIAIVGTRKSSEYGGRFIELFLEKLKDVPDVITVSGLAQGIDSKAHWASIKYEIPTVAVMAISLGQIYPAINKRLSEQILEKNGGWITETSSQETASAGLFPRRNRVIAALSDATFVVETNIKGGSIITAKLANEYHRDVFALPGRYNDNFSKGSNALIQNNQAILVNSPEDIINYMNWGEKSLRKINPNIEIPFEGSLYQKKVLELIRNTPQINIERLNIEMQNENGSLAEALVNLELNGYIRSKAGNQYEIV